MSIAPISPGTEAASVIPTAKLVGSNAGAEPTARFGQLIEHFVSDANAQHVHADTAVQELITGDVDNVHSVVLSVAKADLAFRMVLEIRNRLIDAYQEVMRMQI